MQTQLQRARESEFAGGGAQAPSTIPHVSPDEIYDRLQQSHTPVLILFASKTCAPCKQFLPVIERVAKHFGDRLSVVQFDVNASLEHIAVTSHFEVRAVPTLLFSRNGKSGFKVSGPGTEKQVIDLIKSNGLTD